MTRVLPPLIDGGEVFDLATVNDFQTGAPYGNDGYVGYNFRKTAVATTWAANAHMSAATQSRWSTVNSVGFGIWWDNWTTTPTPQTVMTNGLSVADKLCWLYTEDAVTFLLPQGQTNGRGAPGATASQIAQVNAARAANPTKLLVYNGTFTGGDSIRPSPQYIANNIGFLSTVPFNGTVIHAKSLNDVQAGTTDLSYRLFSTDNSFDYNAINTLLAPLSGLNFGNLQYNYVSSAIALLGGNPGLGLTRIDYYDDAKWNIVLAKASNLARVMNALGILGLWIDTEDYGSGWAAYASQLNTATYSIEDYRLKAFQRGRQLMQTLRGQHPQISVISLVAPLFQTDNHPFYTGYELAGPFYQGMMSAVMPYRADGGNRARYSASGGNRLRYVATGGNRL